MVKYSSDNPEIEHFELTNNLEKQSLSRKFTPNFNDLTKQSKSDAYLAASDALKNNKVDKLRLKIIRLATEAAAQKTIGSDAIHLDSFVVNRNICQGDNYPLYDILSKNEIASVKTHFDKNGNLDNHAISRYTREFGEICGLRTEHKIKEDGKNIIKIRDAGAPMPKGLENANENEASNYLQRYGVFRIPDDHVEKIRTEIKNLYNTSESKFFFFNKDEIDINKFIQRIQPIGLTSVEIFELVDRFY